MSRIFIVLLLAFSLTAGAQHMDKIQFVSQSHDFGEIYEANGPATTDFHFVNIYDDSLRITDVKASCGCTTPSWTKEVLAPGDSGFVQAQYNPTNRPGFFNKSLTVKFDKIDDPVTLLIRGKVIPTAGSIEEDYRNQLGGIRLKYKTLNMGKVFTTDEPTEKRFMVYNASDTIIAFMDSVSHPSHVVVSFDPLQIAPGEVADLIVLYDAKKKNDLGFSSDNITFYTSERGDDSQKSIDLYATIEEYFSPLTDEELKVAPHLSIKDPLYDFDDINEGVRVVHKFTVSNSGQSKLEIRQVKGNCACITATIGKWSLSPGESTEVEVTFDSSQRKGNQQKSITVYSNDPTSPAQRMSVRARVKD